MNFNCELNFIRNIVTAVNAKINQSFTKEIICAMSKIDKYRI